MSDLIIHQVDAPFIVKRVTNHETVKQSILSSIKSMGVHSMEEPPIQAIFNCDWHLPNTYQRAYLNAVLPIINQHNLAVQRALGHIRAVQTDNIWFQQYREGNFHSWHVHPKAMFSNVYFVELPSKTIATTFRVMGKEFQVDAEEGDILTFPSFYEHCSKTNDLEGIKTVIAFNTNGGM